MDPVSALAMATAAYNGLKKAVELGREVQDVFGQLGKWAEAAGEVQSFISAKENKRPGLFKKINLSSNDTREAFDILKAKEQLRFMEQEIYKMFVYGSLQHLGQEGYRDFIKIRKEIREKKERLLKQQMIRRQQFFENVFWVFILLIVLALVAFVGYIIYDLGVTRGKW